MTIEKAAFLDAFEQAFGNFVSDQYSPDVWKVVRSIAEAMKEQSQGLHANFMRAACNITYTSPYQMGNNYGRYFVKTIIHKGFKNLVLGVGRNIAEFICNINTFIEHLNLTMNVPDYVAPEFRAEKVTDCSLELHYWSTRADLGYWVIGICTAVAEEIYSSKVFFELVRGRERKDCDHEVWLVTFPKQVLKLGHHRRSSTGLMYRWAPDSHLFHDLFPFHAVLDSQLRVLQFGKGLGALANLSVGSQVQDHLKMIWPYSGWDFHVNSTVRDGCFLITTQQGVHIKAGLYPTSLTDGSNALLLMGSLRAEGLDVLQVCGMNVADIPPHDASADFIVLAEQRRLESNEARKLKEDKLGLAITSTVLHLGKEHSRRENMKLKEKLALALKDSVHEEPIKFTSDTPAEKTIRILDSLIRGEKLDMASVKELREKIVASGGYLHKPTNAFKKMLSVNSDMDVNRSLMTLLAINEEEEMRRSTHDGVMSGAYKTKLEAQGSGTPSKTSLTLTRGQSEELAMSLLIQPTDHVLRVLSKIDNWQFDSFELDTATQGHSLSTLAYFILTKSDLIPDLRNQLSLSRLAQFLLRMEAGYADNPYHCRAHGADVVRNIYVILTRGGVLKTLWPENHELGFLVAILSAVVHDFEHKGVNNDFLVKSGDQLALLYNDRSPMENHHLYAAFNILGDTTCDFLRDLPVKQKVLLRKQVIDMVLSTDMKQHFSQVSLFNTKFASMVSQPGEGVRTELPVLPSIDDETRIMVLQMCIKCADLGHLTSSYDVHCLWVQRLENEFFQQGDQEKAVLLPVSPLMDRTKEGVTKSQPGFFNIVALPQFQSFSLVFPGCRPLLEAVERNYSMWLEEATKCAT